MGVHDFFKKASANKRDALRISSFKGPRSSCAANEQLIKPEVFEELCEKSKNSCNEMRASVLSAVKNTKKKGENQGEAENSFVKGRKSSVDKWCLLFL